MNKRFSLVLAFSLLPFALALVAAGETNRSLLFQIGAGYGYPGYPSELEEAFSDLDALPGVDRIQLSVGLALGLAISDQGYFMARVDGVGDRLDDGYDYHQMNVYLYSLGFRYYPSVTGLYLEGCIGGSRAVFQSSLEGTYVSEFDAGYGIGVGYSFNDNPRGFGLTLEARYGMLSIEGDPVSAFMLLLSLCWT